MQSSLNFALSFHLPSKSGKYAGTGKISEKRNETGVGGRGNHLFGNRNDANGKSQQTKAGSTGRSAGV